MNFLFVNPFMITFIAPGRDSNPYQIAKEILNLVAPEGLEPSILSASVSKTDVYTNSTTGP